MTLSSVALSNIRDDIDEADFQGKLVIGKELLYEAIGVVVYARKHGVDIQPDYGNSELLDEILADLEEAHYNYERLV